MRKEKQAAACTHSLTRGQAGERPPSGLYPTMAFQEVKARGWLNWGRNQEHMDVTQHSKWMDIGTCTSFMRKQAQRS